MAACIGGAVALPASADLPGAGARPVAPRQGGEAMESVAETASAGESGSEDSVKLLPERLRGLITRSKALQADIRRLDVTMHARPDLAIASRSNPVERQLDLLKAAFETDDL